MCNEYRGEQDQEAERVESRKKRGGGDEETTSARLTSGFAILKFQTNG